MAGRIRTLKPEWLENENLASCCDAARVMSAGLVLLADDFGNGRGAPGYLTGQIWAYRDPVEARETLERASRDLLRIRYMRFYRVAGQTYYNLPGWERHQKVDKPSRTRAYPTPKESDFIQTEFDLVPPSRDPRETLVLDPIRSDQDPTRSGAEEEAAAAPARMPLGRAVDELWSEYERTAAAWNLNAKARTPGDEQPIRLLLDGGWTLKQIKLGLGAVAARAAAFESERAWFDGKRTWRPEVLREALARVSSGAPAAGALVVSARPARRDRAAELAERAAALEAVGE